ncbi:H-type small acid-soluble spore protein [Paenibacillus physcomitrellae]|uniref:Small, acid-soluble spore protein H n=1 Tax=Paenibacillus physcomitrellae TaxID=1619311 RepID=A0ABQ1FV18_9BACL|nr:H-type small acid-soluble spore protein [Paenibacillus physcomitrellae]GGA29755.1 small, acid-soluble spore protein H [Paenibacillus physcomitrellae]
MNIQRAQEIVSSPEMISVTCEGAQIYIQHVDEQRETARVFPVGRPQEERDVPINMLEEQG